jgi:23S rRNA (uracil1939-C5)-methyltransferase
MTEINNLPITGLGAQGDGLARWNDRPVFVAGTLPGETVAVRLPDGPKPSPHATLTKVVTPSPDRVSAPCPHFLTCGGCALQHMAPTAMTAWKQERLRALLAREGLALPPFEPPVVTAPATRRRARFAARHTKRGVVLGFNAERSTEIVDVTTCTVLVPALTALLPRLRAGLAAWLPKGESCDVQATALPHGIDVLLIGGRACDLAAREALGQLAETADIAQLSWRKDDRAPCEPIAMRHSLTLTFGATSVPFPAGSFLQATPAGEEALLRFSNEAAPQATSFLDLFCGLGGFGLAHPTAKRRVFADVDGPALAALRHALRGDAHATVHEHNLLRSPFTPHELAGFDAVLFDPPRGGAKAQATALAQSDAPTVIAISCDPPAFARDATLLAQGGYRLEKIQMVDQFLWSPHTEVAALFSKA